MLPASLFNKYALRKRQVPINLVQCSPHTGLLGINQIDQVVARLSRLYDRHLLKSNCLANILSLSQLNAKRVEVRGKFLTFLTIKTSCKWKFSVRHYGPTIYDFLIACSVTFVRGCMPTKRKSRSVVFNPYQRYDRWSEHRQSWRAQAIKYQGGQTGVTGVQINEETIYACVPPSNSLGLVSDLRAF